MNESAERRIRSRLLPAQVEIALAAHDIDMARIAAGELAAIAAEIGAPYLRAASGQAAGSVRLAEGDAQGGLASLREAEAIWRDLEAPYEAARTRVLIAVACRELGDEGAAGLELEAARSGFRAARRGAGPGPGRAARPHAGAGEGRERAHARGSCKSSGWSRPARPTGPSPAGSGSARKRWPAT